MRWASPSRRSTESCDALQSCASGWKGHGSRIRPDREHRSSRMSTAGMPSARHRSGRTCALRASPPSRRPPPRHRLPGRRPAEAAEHRLARHRPRSRRPRRGLTAQPAATGQLQPIRAARANRLPGELAGPGRPRRRTPTRMRVARRTAIRHRLGRNRREPFRRRTSCRPSHRARRKPTSRPRLRRDRRRGA